MRLSHTNPIRLGRVNSALFAGVRLRQVEKLLHDRRYRYAEDRPAFLVGCTIIVNDFRFSLLKDLACYVE